MYKAYDKQLSHWQLTVFDHAHQCRQICVLHLESFEYLTHIEIYLSCAIINHLQATKNIQGVQICEMFKCWLHYLRPVFPRFSNISIYPQHDKRVKWHSLVLVLLHLSAAFGTENHIKLNDRLENMVGLPDTALNWFKSYQTDADNFVSIGNCVSERTKMTWGSPRINFRCWGHVILLLNCGAASCGCPLSYLQGGIAKSRNVSACWGRLV